MRGLAVLALLHFSTATLYTNARVYTMASYPEYADSFCVEGSRFTAVGSLTRVASECSGEYVDLHGRTVMPGLIDSHAHLMWEGWRLLRPQLDQCDSIASVVDTLVAHKNILQSEWIQGFGWDQTKWGDTLPTRWDLDTAFPNTPIFLTRIDGHACWINSAAMALVDVPDMDPEGGRVERDADGRPTGVFTDMAMELVKASLPPDSMEDKRLALESVLRACRASGLTSVVEPGVEKDDIEMYKAVVDEGGFTLRNYVMRWGMNDSPVEPFSAYKDLLRVRGVKFMLDGALGSWGAAMLEPYSDKNESGYLTMDEQEFYTNASRWMEHGYQVATHAIGDRANQMVLNVYERLLRDTGDIGNFNSRLRVEHAQIVHPNDIIRMADLGVIPSMQPTHATSDMGFAETRLGKQRMPRAYAWASFLRAGARVLPLGSDFPTVGKVPPVLGIYAGVTRQDIEGKPEHGWFPDQRMTRHQVMKGYTMDGAYASFREDEIGSIEPGKFADFIVLDSDIFTIPAKNLFNVSVVATYLGGELIYSQTSAIL